MNRYRSYGDRDDPPLPVGDEQFIGVDEYSNPENIAPGLMQQAVNVDFSTQNAETRGGFVCLPELGAQAAPMKWNQNTLSGSESWSSIVFGKNKFVCLDDTKAMYSTDGINWNQVTVDASLFTFTDIAYGNDVFIGTASNPKTDPASRGIVRSTDGITWTRPATAPTDTCVSVKYGNGIWVALVVTADYKCAISSDNGLTWTTTANIPQLNLAQYLSYGNGYFIAVTSSGQIAYSTNGTAWTLVSNPPSGQWIDVAFGNNCFVAIDQFSNVARSTNAKDWTLVKAYTQSPSINMNAVIFANGRFCTIGTNYFAWSIDGYAWISYSLGFSNSWSNLAYGNGVFVGTGTIGYNLYSYDVSSVIYGSGLYSDPNSIGVSWIMILGGASVGFYANGHASRTVSLGGYTVTAQSTIVQANNYVYVFRGPNAAPIYWNGDWNTSFQLVPATTLPATYNSIPNSSQATYYQNRLWVINGKDTISASDVLAFTDYDPLANELSTNTGNSDYLVATFPFGQNALVAFKNKSIQLLQNVSGSISDVTTTEITRQVGLVGINAICSVGPSLAYVSYGNINLLILTQTNNALQHQTLPLSPKIRKIMNRVNWQVASKISLGYWNNKLYIALPLDNSLFCNAVVVYNFITESWYGEWNFDSTMNMCIQGFQVMDYLGLQRLHAITEDGRIFVTDEGQNDISGTTVAEISLSLTTRAYNTGNLNHFQRRMFADLSTNRPKFSAWSYTEGGSEESTLLTDQTYTRSQSWLFNDSTYDLTNANNDYNRAYRRDYSTGPASVQCGTGFQPEMCQDIRLPLITRRQGRLSWLKFTNTQGYAMVKSIGLENRAGQRSSYVQA